MKNITEDLQYLLDGKSKIQDIYDEMRNIEESLSGMELVYQGNHASIIYVDTNTQSASVYVENEDGEYWEVDMSLLDLMDLLG